MRGILGVIGGIVVWIVVATIGNLLLRAVMPGYADVEEAMTFSLAMQLARLAVGALASLAAGFAVARIAQRDGRFVWALTIVLVAVFAPIHYGLRDRFPLWYHLAFFASLVLATPAGAALLRGRSSR